ncbi:hypothetical protein N7539_003071 [Penicillium diatomitis]|uniref:Uncharacterized protein n=1 Tax=Penicillium diatomitis TaxID=2819901 RepID=A0A9X0BZG8_9EURO|nr:uncharacterized protein N7539_003071 [Penicillium diatomitis]KAJ5491504.1 hypothetical protein N7539_003071 [Penicillium diatomitis]
MLLPHGARRTLGQILQPTMDDEDEETSDTEGSESEDQESRPDAWDVLQVRALLQWRLGMPVEIIDQIIDTAEYWPSTTVKMTIPQDRSHRHIRKDRDQVLLKTVPLCFDRKVGLCGNLPPSPVTSTRDALTNHWIFDCCLEKQLEDAPDAPHPLPSRSYVHPCRKIVFHISSHDQGPGRCHPDMYEHSWTWFDVEVIRAAHTKKMYANGEEQELLPHESGDVVTPRTIEDPLLLPGPGKLQNNGARVAERQDVEIVWHYQDNIPADSPEALEMEKTKGRGRATLDGQFVRDLQVGDSIAIWARARFPGWSNHVYYASATVFWAI